MPKAFDRRSVRIRGSGFRVPWFNDSVVQDSNLVLLRLDA